MHNLAGATAIITGASRGLGAAIAHALAKEQMKLVLVARSAPDLERVAAELRPTGREILVFPGDVTSRAALDALVATAEQTFGSIDVLVNNAGAVTSNPYHRLSWEEIDRVLQVDFVAPMLLTRLVLPSMLARGRGHVVNIASLAGKVGLGYQEAYCSSKAGLITFTASLRASYRGTGVSASVVCPGFVTSAGMFQRFQEETRIAAPPLFGVSSPGQVARAVVDAIKHDSPEILVSPRPIRPMLVLQALFPGLSERILRRIGGDIFIRAAGRAETTPPTDG
jgi:short-subunit dehydrogenase